MARLEDLQQGAHVRGLDRTGVATIEAVSWVGEQAVKVIYRTPSGALKDRLVYRDDEPTLELAAPTRQWSFDGDGDLLRLVSEANRYVGLRVGHLVAQAAIGRGTLLVKPSAARAQVERERAEQPAGRVDPVSPTVPHQGGRASAAGAPGVAGAPAAPPKTPALPTSYFGSKKLDAARIGSAAGQIAEDVLQHLSTLPGAQVEVRIEIQVRVPKGIPEQARRVVGENARSLKFDSSEFSS